MFINMCFLEIQILFFLTLCSQEIEMFSSYVFTHSSHPSNKCKPRVMCWVMNRR